MVLPARNPARIVGGRESLLATDLPRSVVHQWAGDPDQVFLAYLRNVFRCPARRPVVRTHLRRDALTSDRDIRLRHQRDVNVVRSGVVLDSAVDAFAAGEVCILSVKEVARKTYRST